MPLDITWTLVDGPGITPRAVEEYFRRFGLSNIGRLIQSDIKRKGVDMKKGKITMVPIGFSATDERAYLAPFTADIERNDLGANGVSTYNSCGHGPHKCVD